MKIRAAFSRGNDRRRGRRSREGGLALLLVLLFLGVSVVVLSSMLSWTSQNALLTQRHQDYHTALAVQNVAGELAVHALRTQMNAGGISSVNALDSTDWVVQFLDEEAYWDDYQFAVRIEPWLGVEHSPLLGTYGGMEVRNQKFVITTGARWLGVEASAIAAVEELVQVAEIPIFAFALLYEYDLTFIGETFQGLVLDGRVHGNQNLYVHPGGPLTFGNHVTAGLTNYPTQHPNDTDEVGNLVVRELGLVTYLKENGGDLGRLRIPGAGNNAREAIETGYRDRAQLRIFVSDAGLLALSQSGDDFTSYATNFVTVSTNSFPDRRETREIWTTEIDIANLLAHYSPVQPRILYVEDSRVRVEQINAVRLVNGHTLPEAGLTIVTPNPLYIRGDYNIGVKRPSALVADAVTILSGGWDDTLAYAISPAQDTTVNAAILTGIVPSEAGQFDGGVFNALRLLEDWTERVFTFSGSVVVLYPSEQADEPWSTDSSIYDPPVRRWTFDPAYLEPDYLPWTPVVCALVRADWGIIAPPEWMFPN
jgi:hypothetical protein